MSFREEVRSDLDDIFRAPDNIFSPTQWKGVRIFNIWLLVPKNRAREAMANIIRTPAGVVLLISSKLESVSDFGIEVSDEGVCINRATLVTSVYGSIPHIVTGEYDSDAKLDSLKGRHKCSGLELNSFNFSIPHEPDQNEVTLSTQDRPWIHRDDTTIAPDMLPEGTEQIWKVTTDCTRMDTRLFLPDKVKKHRLKFAPFQYQLTAEKVRNLIKTEVDSVSI